MAICTFGVPRDGEGEILHDLGTYIFDVGYLLGTNVRHKDKALVCSVASGKGRPKVVVLRKEYVSLSVIPLKKTSTDFFFLDKMTPECIGKYEGPRIYKIIWKKRREEDSIY